MLTRIAEYLVQSRTRKLVMIFCLFSIYFIDYRYSFFCHTRLFF